MIHAALIIIAIALIPSAIGVVLAIAFIGLFIIGGLAAGAINALLFVTNQPFPVAKSRDSKLYALLTASFIFAAFFIYQMLVV